MRRGAFLLGALLGLLVACAPRVTLPVAEELDTLGPVFYCGIRKGAPLPHQVFVAEGTSVELALLGGESAAIGVEERVYPQGQPGTATPLLGYPAALSGCLVPPLAQTFKPEGPFALVHVFGEDREKVYSEDALNTGERGMRAYEALDLAGRPVGVLILIEEWVDADYNDAVLLLKGARPLR